MIYRAAAVLWVAGFMAVVWGRSEAGPSGSGLSRAAAVSPAGLKSIEALLSEAGDQGYDVAPLRNKLLEGRAKGKSDEAILKALRLRMYKMESSSQLSPSKEGFHRALFLLEAAPKNTGGKLALDGKLAGTEKQASLPPATKSKTVQVKKEPVWTPVGAGKGTPGRTSLTGSSEVSLPVRGQSKEKPSVASRSSEFPEKPATPGQGRMGRLERRGKNLDKQEQKLGENLERRQDKLEDKLERKQKNLEDKEKILEKKVRALERALEKSERRRGRP